MTTEADQVRWRGIRLAAGEVFLPTYPYVAAGTQVVKSEVIIDDSKAVHTVSDGKVFYLSAISLCGEGTGNGIISLEVLDDGLNLKYHFFCTDFKAGEIAAESQSFVPALMIPEKWSVVVTSGAANVEAHGFVHGFELTA